VVEGAALVEERKCGVGCLIGIDACEAEPGRVVNGGVGVLPAGFAFGLPRAVTGDAVAGRDDPAQLLQVDVQELAGTLALVTNDSGTRLTRMQARAVVPGEDRVHR